jgi:ribonuclease Z
MEHIFLTQKSWGKFGGVPGLSLTLQEIGLPQITLHGPSGISDIFQSIRRFVVLKDMKVNTPECLEGGFFEDSVMRVNYVPLFKEKGEEKTTQITEFLDWAHDPSLTKDDTDYYSYEKKGESSSTNRPQSPTSNISVKSLDEHVMAYICKLQPKPGHLNLEACVERGVKPGPLLGRLKNGFDVTLPDGSIVKADDVRGPCCPGPVYIFVDVPDKSYVPALLACERFKQHQKNVEIEDDRALVVIHFSPEDMMTNLDYREWMDRFPSTTNHLFVNERNTFTGFFATHRIQRQLHELTPQVFPMLKETHPYMIAKSDMAVDISELEEDESPEKKFKFDTEGDLEEEEKKNKFDEFPELGVRTTFHLRPPTGFDRNKEPYNHPETVMEETYVNSPELPMLITAFKAKAEQIVQTRSVAERNKEFPRVLLLGTGSMIPNKTRNVSANLIHFSPESCGLFDCGEGTLGQIVRFYGREEADEVLKKLKLIYISHLHADHHLGLLNILNRRRKITNDKVLLVAPHQINVWLTFYNNQIDEISSTYDLVPCTDFVS